RGPLHGEEERAHADRHNEVSRRKRIVPLPGAIVDLLLAQRESQSVERGAAQLWSERAGSLRTRLVGPSIPEPTGTAGSVYLQPLVRDGRLHDAHNTGAAALRGA